MNFDGRSVGRLFVLRDASSLDDASSRSFNKRLALSPVDASNRPRRVTLRAEAAAISINILAAMVLKFGLADLRVRNRVSALELEVGVRRFLPQRALVRAGHSRRTPERVGPGADGRGAEEGRRARQVRGRPGRGAAAHLRQILDEARVDGRHRACVVRRRLRRGGFLGSRRLSRRSLRFAVLFNRLVDGVSPAFEAGRFLGSQGLLAGGRAAQLVLWASRVVFNRLGTPRPHRMPLGRRLQLGKLLLLASMLQTLANNFTNAIPAPPRTSRRPSEQSPC